MWPDGWMDLDRVGTRVNGAFLGSPLLGCEARLGPKMIPDGFGPNGNRRLVALFCATVLTGGWGPSS